MATYRRIHWLGLLGFLVFSCEVLSKPLPQSTVTQSGEPSHFQVDDKAAEIEVNANPAGVKVNAKPASLQVVAKPGTPAIPVYHPAIHIAPHYLPPPIVHREPAMFYHYHHRHHPCLPPLCIGRSRGWFYAGLRRDELPKPAMPDLHRSFSEDTQGDKSSVIPRPLDRDDTSRGLDDRNTLEGDLDDDGHLITRKEKSSIPKPEKEVKHKGSHKRQFIAAAPQLYQPQALSALRQSPYAIQSYNSLLASRAPLARNIISSYAGVPVRLSSFSPNAMSSLYGQSLSSNSLGGLNVGGFGSSALGMYRGYQGYSQSQLMSNPVIPYGQTGNNFGGSGSNGNAIGNFMQSELTHELYGTSSAIPSPLRLEKGYSRSIISPYEQQLSEYGTMSPGRSLERIGSPIERQYGTMIPERSLESIASPLVGPLQPNYQGGLISNYGNSALMQMARLYGSQPQPALIPGLQTFTEAPEPQQQLSYPFLLGRNAMAARSKVPGSKLSIKKSNQKVDKSQNKGSTINAPKDQSGKDALANHQTSSKNNVATSDEKISNTSTKNGKTKDVDVNDETTNEDKNANEPGHDYNNKIKAVQNYVNTEETANVGNKHAPLDHVQGEKEGIKYNDRTPSAKIQTREESEKNSTGEEKKSRKKRQLIGGYDLDALQDALVNEFKREMILGAPAEPPPIPALNDAQSSLGLPFSGIERIPAGNPGNVMGLSQMATLNANYISPLQRLNRVNPNSPIMRDQAINSIALGRSQISPDQFRLMPEMTNTVTSPFQSQGQAPFVREIPQQFPQSLIQNRPNGLMQNSNEYVGSPMRFNQEYRSPIEYDDRRPSRFRRPSHPLFRRRLHHRYYDDDDGYDDDYHESRPLFHEHLGRERVSIGGSYSENEVPNTEGETLVDTSNHGFGPIEVEAKTAEGLRNSLRDLKRGDITKPKITAEHTESSSGVKKEGKIFRHGVL